MRRILSVLAAVAAMGAVALTGPAAAQVSEFERPENTVAIRLWMDDMREWADHYHGTIADAVALISEINDGVDRAGGQLETGTVAGDTSWVGPWAERQRAAMADIRARTDRRLPQPRLMLKGRDRTEAFMEYATGRGATTLPATARTVIDRLEPLALAAIELTVRAMRGDQRSGELLTVTAFDMNIEFHETRAVLWRSLYQGGVASRSVGSRTIDARAAVDELFATGLRLVREDDWGDGADATERKAAADRISAAAATIEESAAAISRLAATPQVLAAEKPATRAVAEAMLPVARETRRLSEMIVAGPRLDAAAVMDQLDKLRDLANTVSRRDGERRKLN